MKVAVSPDAQKEMIKLPKVIRRRLRDTFVKLQDWPKISGAKPLRGNRAGWYRKRTGDYRIIFRVEDDMVFIEKVGHRRNVYEE